MTTLTIHFAHEDVAPIQVHGCEAEFVDLPGDPNTSFELPAHDGKHREITQAMIAASGGALHMAASVSGDLYAFFDKDTDAFTFWQGDGDHKDRGYRLDTANPLPYMESITATPEEGDNA